MLRRLFLLMLLLACAGCLTAPDRRAPPEPEKAFAAKLPPRLTPGQAEALLHQWAETKKGQE
jgi:hypothetical protein